MIEEKKTTLDVIDELYSLAYWLTGSKKNASKLIKKTYLSLEKNSSVFELVKKFRLYYFESIGQAPMSGFMGTFDQPKERLNQSLWKRYEEIKLAVLLSEIPGLKHRDICEITGNTLETIRLWLSWGRKQLINDTLMNRSVVLEENKINTNIFPQTTHMLIQN